VSKYDPLGDFLTNTRSNIKENTLTFSQIEKILGFQLPYSAYHHRAWWANPSSATDHPYAQAWLAAGWKVESVKQSEKWVRFERI